MATICIIEDEEAIRDLVAEELADYGHKVHAAADGLAGYDLIVETRPDLVISDINMPKAIGFETRARLARDPDVAGKPFIFLSAFADKADIADGMVVGADAYRTKPIDFSLLIRRIDKLT